MPGLSRLARRGHPDPTPSSTNAWCIFLTFWGGRIFIVFAAAMGNLDRQERGLGQFHPPPRGTEMRLDGLVDARLSHSRFEGRLGWSMGRKHLRKLGLGSFARPSTPIVLFDSKSRCILLYCGRWAEGVDACLGPTGAGIWLTSPACRPEARPSLTNAWCIILSSRGKVQE